MSGRPKAITTISPGVDVTLDFDPDGFLGRDLCVCGDAEDDHRYDDHFFRGGRKESVGRMKGRCHAYVPKRRAPHAEAVKVIEQFTEAMQRPQFARAKGAR